MAKVKLTGAQRAALTDPCFTGEACVNPKFYLWKEHRGRYWRVGLTANIGEE